jgi:hypothetical protein
MDPHLRPLLAVAAMFWLIATPIRGETVQKAPFMEVFTKKLQDTYWMQWQRLHTPGKPQPSHENMKAELRAWQRLDAYFDLESRDTLPPNAREDPWLQENRPEETIFAQPTAEVWIALPPRSESTEFPIFQ